MDTAAVVFVHSPSGKVGLQLRSAKVEEPNTWAGTGGYVEAGEHPQRAVYREIEEELGIDLRGQPLRLVSHDKNHYLYRMEVPVMFQPNLNWESADFAWKHPSEWRAMSNIHPELYQTLFNRDYGAEEPHSVDLWSGSTNYCWTIPHKEWLGEIKECLNWYANKYATMWEVSIPSINWSRELQNRYGINRIVLDLLQKHIFDKNNPVITSFAESLSEQGVNHIADQMKDRNWKQGVGVKSPLHHIKISVLDFIAYVQGLTMAGTVSPERIKFYIEILNSQEWKSAVNAVVNGIRNGDQEISAKELNFLIFTLSGLRNWPKLPEGDTPHGQIKLPPKTKDVALLSINTLSDWLIYLELWKQSNGGSRLYGTNKKKFPNQFTCNTTFGRPINPYIPTPRGRVGNLFLGGSLKDLTLNLSQYHYRHPSAFTEGIEVVGHARSSYGPIHHVGSYQVEINYKIKYELFHTPYPLQPASGDNAITLEPLNFGEYLIGLPYKATTLQDWNLCDEMVSDFSDFFVEDWIKRDENGNLGATEEGNPTDSDYEELEENSPKFYRYLQLRLLLENEAGESNRQGRCAHQDTYRATSRCNEYVLVFKNSEKQDTHSEGIYFEDDEFYCPDHLTNTYELEGYGDIDLGEDIPLDYAKEAAEELAKDYY